ncbi:MAG: FeS assembly SUF system protein [Candidatus Tokpelaia sp. JSC161]|jgi:FeS assembly SUF system protein|nr:MAG: FeS assembly SUF system protein [Candidatus Tokpelaia sp. JSC161]
MNEEKKEVTFITAESQSRSLPSEEIDRLTKDIITALKTIYDPEISVDIYELGLIYRIEIDPDRTVHIEMTLTAPSCPVAGEIPVWVKNSVSAVEGISHVEVIITFDPQWTADRMSEEARIAVGWY